MGCPAYAKFISWSLGLPGSAIESLFVIAFHRCVRRPMKQELDVVLISGDSIVESYYVRIAFPKRELSHDYKE